MDRVRPIDANALMRRVKNEACEHYPDIYLNLIDKTPTVDAATVRHAKWNKAYRSEYAPRDGKFIRSACDCWNSGRTDYCPHCGAKMNKEAPGDG